MTDITFRKAQHAFILKTPTANVLFTMILL